MRKWYKYFIVESDESQDISLPIDRTFEEHAEAMGGYGSEGYGSREEFFETYIAKRHHIFYDHFIRQHLSKEETVLSVASGRCANELWLLSQGYDIFCSDLAAVNLEGTKALFPEFRFQALNILKNPSDRLFDSIIALSMVYFLDDREFPVFFENVSNSLKTGGHLILDGASSPDNLMSFFIHDMVLKYEARLLIVLRRLIKKQKLAFVKKHHGFRRTDKEIIDTASKAGFALLGKHGYDYLTEFRRSYFFSRFIKDSYLEKPFETLGRWIPYVRMFYFEKVN